MKTLKVGLVQQSCGQDIPANIQKLQQHIRECASQGAELVVLQELHNSVYFCQTEEARLCDLAETIPGPSTESYGALAKELGIVIVLSLFERRAPGIYHNTAVVLEKDGTIAGTYRKMGRWNRRKGALPRIPRTRTCSHWSLLHLHHRRGP